MTIDQLQNAIHEQIMKLELDLVYARSRLVNLADADEEIIDEAQCAINALECDHDRFSDAWNVINTVELWSTVSA